jgi:hypothetical protein
MADVYVLQPRPPFSFDQALVFLRRFPPTLGERAVVDGDGHGHVRGGRHAGLGTSATARPRHTTIRSKRGRRCA